MVERHIAKAPAAAPQEQRAIVFELEMLAANGRKILWETLQRVLAARQITLTRIDFLRYCLDGRLEQGLADFLRVRGKKRGSETKVVEKVLEEWETAFGTSDCKPDSGVRALITRARDAGIRLGTLSRLGVPTMEKLLRTLGCDDPAIRRLSCTGKHKPFPTAEGWLSLCKALRVRPLRSVAVVTSRVALLSALNAGTRCVVVYDEFTAHHDFSGADFVADRLDNSLLENIFALLGSA